MLQKIGNLDSCQFLKASRQSYSRGKQDIKTAAKQLLDKPVNIPRKFFEKKINEFLCEKYPEFKSLEMNTAYMIQLYFEKNFGSVQPFYSYRKNYPVVSKANEYCKRANSGIAKHLASISADMSYSEMKSFIEKNIPVNGRFDPEHLRDNLLEGCKDYKKNERLLRQYKVQDMISYMMVEATLKEHLSYDGKVIKLEDITPTGESPFNKPVLCRNDIYVSFNTGLKHYDNGYVGYIKKNFTEHIVNQGKKIILEYKITSEDTKLKDIGKYHRYFHDRRIGGLLIWKYPPNGQGDTEIKYADIEKEIDAYDQYRIKTAEHLFLLEKKVLDCFENDFKFGEKNISFNEITDKVKAEVADSEGKCDTLLKIRNAINHNQFPVFSDIIENTSGETIAEKMFAVTEKYVNSIMENICQSDKENSNA